MNAVVPYIISFFSVFCYAVLPVITKKMIGSVPPFSYIALTMFILTLLSAAVAFFTEKDFKITSITPVNWYWLLSFGVVNLLGFAGMIYAVANIPVVHHQLVRVLLPIFSGVLAVFVLKEPFLVRYLVGGAFMAVGLFIAVYKA